MPGVQSKVAKYIDTYAHNEDMFFFNASYCVQPFNYYSRNDLLVRKGFQEKGNNADEENINKLWETIEHHDRIWVILSHSGDKKELIIKTLINSFNLSYQKKHPGIKFYLFDKEEYAKNASKSLGHKP